MAATVESVVAEPEPYMTSKASGTPSFSTTPSPSLSTQPASASSALAPSTS